MIFLEHPQHGTKIALSEEEASYDAKQGWGRCVIKFGTASGTDSRMVKRAGRPRRTEADEQTPAFLAPVEEVEGE